MAAHTPTMLRSHNWIDALIKGREALLDGLLGVNAGQLLNASAVISNHAHSGDLSAELKKALAEMVVAAVGESGAHVDYDSLKNSEAYHEFSTRRSPLLKGFNPSLLATRQERLAFWINLYNALVLDGIIRFGITTSVSEMRMGVLSFFRKAAYQVGDQRLSLDDIEHGILRGNRGHPYLPGAHFATSDPRRKWVIAAPDARIHFTLNCASRSCPPIQAYTAEALDAQLDMAARSFIDASVQVNESEGVLLTSMIFKWYRADFGGAAGVIDAISEHLPNGKRREWIQANRDALKLRYQPYDWGLNSKDKDL